MISLIKRNRYLNKQQLQTIVEWKAPRIIGRNYLDRNSNEDVKEITRLALSTQNERLRIEVLTVLGGVGWPMASVILHFFHAEPYPILDVRALWSLGVEKKYHNYSLWEEYFTICRAIASRNGVDMRTLDRALWQYSKERQKQTDGVTCC